MKILIGYIMIVGVLLSLVGFNLTKNFQDKGSDKYVRDRVVMLRNDRGGCSGIQVKAPSGANYILSAAHCRGLLDEKNDVEAYDESGKRHIVHLIEYRIDVDLMLLSSYDDKSIVVANKLHKHEHIHTMTHGELFPTYRTDGELLEERNTMRIVVGLDEGLMDYLQCVISKHKLVEDDTACMIQLVSMITTAPIAPGSSGGAVINDKGELVGIVSNWDGMFSGVVPLHDIKDFLKKR